MIIAIDGEASTGKSTQAKKIAKKGWERGHKCYNEKIITKYFIDIAFNGKATEEYDWPLHTFKK